VLLALCGALAIILFLFVSLRQPARVARVLTPLVLAVLMTMAILVVAGEKLTIFHLVGLLLVAAVGSNYSLFFERKWDAGDEYGCVIASLVLANMCTVTGFGVLSFSGIAVLHGIGLTVAVGAFLSLVFSAIFSKQTP
jgi:predicted exporter